MKWKNIRQQKWFPYTAAICVGVILNVILTKPNVVISIFHAFADCFGTVFLGGVFAYVMNPFAKLLQRTVFKGPGKKQWIISSLMAMFLFLVVVLLLFVTVIPQLVLSIKTFLENYDSYIRTLENMLAGFGVSNVEMMTSIDSFLDSLKAMMSENLSAIISASASIGKGIANIGIALILSLYYLAEKVSLKKGIIRFMKAVTSDHGYEAMKRLYHKCDEIMTKYIFDSLLESVIVGSVNALFMKLTGMPYTGLVSVIVAVTNLIPTFGPVIGAVIGAFILVLANPIHAVLFLVFSVVLQAIDGYIIKPKLFGDALGVSGLMILIAVIVFGKVFGILGIVLAIPAAAVIEYIYKEMILPALEKRDHEVRGE